MTELKPCPFCGGEAEVVYGWNDGEPTHIECMGCGALVDTAEVWNTRAERTCQRITLGLEREREVATVSWICSACGKHINKDHEYCHNCGAKVVSE